MDDYLKAMEEQGPIMDRLLETLGSGDVEERRRCAAQIEWSPAVLRPLKHAAGADFIRQEGFCTRRGDAAFGEGWFDEPNPGVSNGALNR